MLFASGGEAFSMCLILLVGVGFVIMWLLKQAVKSETVQRETVSWIFKLFK
jgi:hypothetical protein